MSIYAYFIVYRSNEPISRGLQKIPLNRNNYGVDNSSLLRDSVRNWIENLFNVNFKNTFGMPLEDRDIEIKNLFCQIFGSPEFNEDHITLLSSCFFMHNFNNNNNTPMCSGGNLFGKKENPLIINFRLDKYMKRIDDYKKLLVAKAFTPLGIGETKIKKNILRGNYNWMKFPKKGGSSFINIPNIGKRKVRTNKSGSKYVIVKGKKKYL